MPSSSNLKSGERRGGGKQAGRMSIMENWIGGYSPAADVQIIH